MEIDRWGLARLLAETMLNTMTLILWRYRKYLQYRAQYSLEQGRLTKYKDSDPTHGAMPATGCAIGHVHAQKDKIFGAY